MTDGDAAPRRWPGAVAGALGAAAALTVIEVVAAFDATGVSVTEAVGNRVIDSFAASLKEVAVSLFGTNDKVALQLGTAIVAIAIGAWLGSFATTRPNVVVAGFAGFALLGVWASWVDALASRPVAVIACGLAATVGTFVTIGLARRWAALEVASADEIGGPVMARRTIVVNGGVTAAVLVLGVAVARSARSSLRSAAATVTRALPKPASTVPTPASPLDRGPDAVDGLSRYVTPTDDFYRIDTAFQAPYVDVESWTLTIGGLVDRELTFTYDQLIERNLVEVPITLMCVSNEVGGDLIGNARWLGVPLRELLDEAGVQPGASQVIGESVDGFTAGFPVEVAMDGRDALVAVGMNGRQLPREHGYPVRLVVPGIYGYVSATKWLSEIRLTTWDEEGYWIPRGWSRLAPIKTGSRIDVPRGRGLAAGPQPIAGVAWAQHRGIEAVEVRIDGGSWERAELGPAASADTWVQWWYRWDATVGDHELSVRAIDAAGNVQTAKRARPDPDGATGHHTIEVSVE